MPRLLLALTLGAAAFAPASAHAFVEVCVHPNDYQYVCHMPERPGCVYGSLGEEGNFGTPACYA